MNPPYSVIFLTTLIGAGQGLFLALFFGQTYILLEDIPLESGKFYAIGSLIALVFLIGGLIASFFHLGRPERAWRAATQWRTSWLSREVIVLPLFMFFVFLYGVLHYFDINPSVFGTAAFPETGLTIVVGSVGVAVCIALFICTGMIYACLKFLQEWHTPLTPINYTLFGMASGCTLAALYTQQQQSHLLGHMTVWAIILTLAVFLTRSASLIRNRRIKYKSTLKTAIGVRHTHIQQKAQGAMGGSYNTREFFHGKKASFLKSIKWIFMILVFPVPVALLTAALFNQDATILFVMAFAVQYIGLIAERWFFFAQARHPQNLYYQTI
ncbi:MAG: dimethyl sulfoxide reductase anchor subunit [Gammaproteobacteria bacterium]|nr:dimethyl sulfoxide reductase anchor subunit [Gammaproteobacteria bacterium]